MTNSTCESCGMPVEAGPYCVHCVDETGALQSFEERLARMIDFIRSRDAAIDETAAKAQALGHMSMMPAWRNRAEVGTAG